MDDEQLLAALALLPRRPFGQVARDVVCRNPAEPHHALAGVALLRLEHEEVVGIADEVSGGRGRGLRDEAIIPHQHRLHHHALWLDRHQRHRPLIADERVLIDIPVELVHPQLVAQPLIDGARFYRDMLMSQSELDHRARAHLERAARRAHGRLQLRPHVLQHDAEARCMDHPLALEHQLAEMPQGAVADDEVGVEEQQVGLGHARSEIGEAAKQGVGQHHAVVAGQLGHQVVERDEPGTAHP